MFPNRNLVERLDDTSDDEGERKFDLSTKTMQLLRSVAPTREERAMRSLTKGPPTLQQVRKKLNFDESYTFSSPSIGRQKTQLIEYEEQMDRLKRKNEMLEKDLQRANRQNQEYEQSVMDLRAKVTELKQDLNEAKYEEKVRDVGLDDSMLDPYQQDEICNTAKKYISWFNTAMEQLRLAEKIIRKGNLWTQETKQQMLEAERVHPIDKDADDLAALAVGSVLDFPGLISLREDDYDQANEEAFEMEQNAAVGETMVQKTIRAPWEMSPIQERPESSEEKEIEVEKPAAIVEKEMNDKINALKAANSILAEKLKIMSIRGGKVLEMEEKNRDLEKTVEELRYRLTMRSHEISAIQHTAINNLCGTRIPDNDSYKRAEQMIENSRLKVQLEELQQQILDLHAKHKKDLEELGAPAETLKKLVEAEKQVKELKQDFDEMRETAEEMGNDIDEMQERLNYTGLRIGFRSHFTHVPRLSTSESSVAESVKSAESSSGSVRRARSSSGSVRRATSSSGETASERGDSSGNDGGEKDENEYEGEEEDEDKDVCVQERRRKNTPSPTDAGDSTAIFHMAHNPLSDARALLEQEERASRKRKALGSSAYESDAKRQQIDEELGQLRQQLAKSESKIQTMVEVHEETLKKLRRFRELTTLLTGCQVKMSKQSDDIVKVSSIYDESAKEFTFKVGAENADLLDMGDQMPSQSTLSWDDAARFYIGERSSVPAFLAKVTLTLEEQRELEVVERTHMFSVLEE